jgi:hypothetical protein
MIKVELGFTESGASAPFFTLDDPVLGLLDSPAGVLGGAEALFDVTSFVRAFNISRGKSRELDRFGAGQATVTFNNNDRTFDPTFAASPFFGQVTPRRQIRISVDDIVQFEGTIDDWNIEYEQGGNSVATCQAFDGFGNLTNLETEGLILAEGFTDDQITQALDNVSWPATKRDLGVGGSVLAAQTIPDGQSVLALMQTMADSDPGDLFIDKTGNVKFVGRNDALSSGGIILSDDGSEISYNAVRVVFGTELLFNSFLMQSLTDEVTATSASSISLYGERDTSVSTFLKELDDLEALGNFLLAKYSDPEYRFDSLTINLKTVTPTQRDDLLGLELGDVVLVEFTPNGIAPAIQRYGKVIRLAPTFADNFETLEVGLESVASTLFVLDDLEFGKLNVGLLGW